MAKKDSKIDFLTAEDVKAINQSVAEAEKNTSAEIKVLVVSESSKMNFFRKKSKIRAAEKRARIEFFKMGLDHTRDSTGVLIMISLKERAVIVKSGDAIEQKVDPKVWQKIVDPILEGITSGRKKEGISLAVMRAGNILAEHFPVKPDDTNEISNEVVFKD